MHVTQRVRTGKPKLTATVSLTSDNSRSSCKLPSPTMSIWNIGKDDVPEHIQALKDAASSKGGRQTCLSVCQVAYFDTH